MADYSRNRRGGEESESFFCRFTFGQFFALLVLEVFTLFFVFYLGARYGREFLGLDKGPKVAVVAPADEATVPTVTTTSDPEAKEIAKDIISKARTPELKERISRMLEEGGPATPAMPSTAPEPMAEAPKPAREPMPMRPPASKPEDTEGGVIRVKSAENARYSIQVGSYQQMAEAADLAEQWKERGYPAYVMIADIPSRGRWYRVRLGGFATRKDASRYLAKLRVKENVSDALIVLNEQ
jgi:cell division septation protein DedD